MIKKEFVVPGLDSIGMWSLLDRFTRQELRSLAKSFAIPVPRGQNKNDTILNLMRHPRNVKLTIKIEGVIKEEEHAGRN